MPPDETVIPDTRPVPHAEANVNVTTPDTGILSGLGQYKSIVALGFAGIGGVLLIYFAQQIVTQGHADRVEDRQIFRDAIHDIQKRADERSGELKGSTDKLIDVVRDNSNLVRQWIDESRRSRAERSLPPRSVELKPPMTP